MKKITRQKVQALLKDVEKNFFQLVDAIIYFELTDKDDWAWDIIHGIEELEPSKEIEMLIEDLANRNYEVPEKLLYNSLWYAQANVLENRETLIDVISKSANVKQIVNYLVPLNKGRNRDADLNIQSVIDEVNAGMKKPKP